MSDVRIRVCAGGIKLEYVGSQVFYDRLIAPLAAAAYRKEYGDAGAEAPVAAPFEPTSSQPAPALGDIFTPSSPHHFSQYAGQVGPRAATVDQRIMAFGFYLWNFERQDQISSEDIQCFFRTVHEEPPADLEGRLQALCAEKRFLESGSADDSWRITTKGLNYVKNRLLGPS